jgi:hypothetical protein
MAEAAPVIEAVVKVCSTCGRFRHYDPADEYCVVCGFASLATECSCGRTLEFAMAEPEGGGLHCPRCGRDWRRAAIEA